MQQVVAHAAAVLQTPVHEHTDEDFEDPTPHDGTQPWDKFTLEGQTLRLPNVRSDDPLGYRIESLRMFLENVLGVTTFVAVYRAMDGIGPDDDDAVMERVEAMMQPGQRPYMGLLAQLIVCEDALNRHQSK